MATTPTRRATRVLTAVVAALVLCSSLLACSRERASDPVGGADAGTSSLDTAADGTTSSTAPPLLDPQDVSLAGVDEHLAALQAIADANGGTRAVGTPGYDASVDYVADRLQEAGYDVRLDPFDIPPSADLYALGFPLPPSSTNVIVETDRVPGDEVVMVGGHLDSVFGGPGLNDNGTGVAAMVELAEWLSEQDGELAVDIRFGFWGAEEIGLVGSTSYVSELARSPGAIDDVIAYINLDMVGSSNGGRFVYDPDVALDPTTTSEGSEAVRDLFFDHFEEAGLPVLSVWTDGRSDEAAFAYVGIPVGGLFSGAETPKTPDEAALFGGEVGVPLAPCYHQPCDTEGNVDHELFAQLAFGFAVVTLQLAVDPRRLDERPGVAQG